MRGRIWMVCASVCLSVCWSACLSIGPILYPSFHWPVNCSFFPSVRPLVHPLVHSSVGPSLHWSLKPSVFPLVSPLVRFCQNERNRVHNVFLFRNEFFQLLYQLVCLFACQSVWGDWPSICLLKRLRTHRQSLDLIFEWEWYYELVKDSIFFFLMERHLFPWQSFSLAEDSARDRQLFLPLSV